MNTLKRMSPDDLGKEGGHLNALVRYTFRKLGIYPFTDESVRRHMEQVQTAANHSFETAESKAHRRFEVILFRCFSIGCAYGFCICFWHLLKDYLLPREDLNTAGFWVLICITVIALVSCILSFRASLKATSKPLAPLEWQKFEWGNAIPEGIRAHILEQISSLESSLKSELPGNLLRLYILDGELMISLEVFNTEYFIDQHEHAIARII